MVIFSCSTVCVFEKVANFIIIFIALKGNLRHQEEKTKLIWLHLGFCGMNLQTKYTFFLVYCSIQMFNCNCKGNLWGSYQPFTVCMQPSSVKCSASQCSTVHHSVAQCSTVYHSAAQCSTLQHGAVQFSAVQSWSWGQIHQTRVIPCHYPPHRQSDLHNEQLTSEMQ